MTTLTFTVTFLGPFAVSTGVAEDGLDITVDQKNPWPSSAIKGLLKAHLRDHLEAPSTLVARIFHAGDSPAWVFSDAQVDVKVNAWARVKVDEHGTAEERHLMVGQQAYAESGSFTITWEGPGEAPGSQILALRAAARSVTSLGSHRRRGLGWVSITDPEPWTAQDSKGLLAAFAEEKDPR